MKMHIFRFFFHLNHLNQLLLTVCIKSIPFLISTVQPIMCSGSARIINTVYYIQVFRYSRFYFTRRCHSLGTYIKVQIIHQAVAKTKTVLSAKATLMNTRPTRHTFYVYIHRTYYIYIFLFCIGLHIMHMCVCACASVSRGRVYIYLPTFYT